MDLPIFFINLDRDAPRRELLQQQFKALSVQGHRLEAVWWANLTEEEQTRWYSSALNARQYYKPLVNGEKGCYASHIKAWQQLLESDAPAMVVLEDDVQLLPDFQETTQAIAQMEQSWDMIKLIGRPQEKIKTARQLTSTHRLIQYQRVPSFTAGYVISRAGAQKLLSSRVPFGRPVDVDIRFWFENNLQVFGVYPYVLGLDELSEVSSIWAQRERTSAVQRIRKLWMKVQLFAGNAMTRAPKLPEH
ncbi:glycosyltransferase family 25 protein [Comamonas sp.]|uniref:glycosyltransferase family 25 protein n=1 Tax=Comamonas sp. TaxID=34028 RepID=UPI0028A2AFFE|nr:glycosyltransferase family 25 protein [Comamonas sp.]